MKKRTKYILNNYKEWFGLNNGFYNPYAQPYCGMKTQNFQNIPQSDAHEAHTENKMCCKKTEPAIPENAVPAMAYVPFQTGFEVYDGAKALRRGTLFMCLDKPFTGCCRNG